MLNRISSLLDAVADSLEAKGFIKEAYEIDKISNKMEEIVDFRKHDKFHYYGQQSPNYSRVPAGNRLHYAFHRSLPDNLESISKIESDFKKFEEEYLRLAMKGKDYEYVPVVDIAKFLGNLKKAIESTYKDKYEKKIKDFDRTKDRTGVHFKADFLRYFIEYLGDMINDCAETIAKVGKFLPLKGKNVDREESENQEAQKKGIDIIRNLPDFSIERIKRYVRPGEAVIEVGSLINKNSRSWYGAWEGVLVSFDVGKHKIRMHSSDGSPEELHGGYDVTGANTENKRKVIEDLKRAGTKSR